MDCKIKEKDEKSREKLEETKDTRHREASALYQEQKAMEYSVEERNANRREPPDTKYTAGHNPHSLESMERTYYRK